jgi:hypothetical protein
MSSSTPEFSGLVNLNKLLNYCSPPFTAYHLLVISLATSFAALLGYFILTYGRLKTAPGSPTPNPELPAKNPQSRHDILTIDGQILDEYEWTVYKKLPSAMKTPIEDALLKSIITQQFPNLATEDVVKACSRLLRDQIFRAVLLKCWEEGSFELLRSYGTLRVNENLKLRINFYHQQRVLVL